jgi:hypothetical protein
MKSNITLLTILLLTIHSITGCKDDEKPPEVNVIGGEILIANEGNFGWGEGTLSIYNETTKEVQNEVYQAKSGESLGNVFHSIAGINDLYYLVMNNSGKIVITDTNFVKKTEITGLTSPRNIYTVTDDKAYVTDLYANAISILDVRANTVIGSIPCNGHSEEGVVLDGKFWFTAPETKNIYAVDIATDAITDSLEVGWMPEGIVLDNQNVIWVLNRGDESRSEDAKLSSVRKVGQDVVIVNNVLDGTPINLVYDELLDRLYFINEDVYFQGTDVELSEPSLWLSAGNKVFYSIKVNPKNSEVYLSDVKDFTSRSTIYRYREDITLLDEFSAGIIAGDFFFP